MHNRRLPALAAIAVCLAGALVVPPAFAAPAPSWASPTSVTQAELVELREVIPADLPGRISSALTAAGVDQVDLDQVVEGQCGPSQLDLWLAENIDVTDEELIFLLLSGATAIPMLESMLFGDVEGTNSYGSNGEHTKAITQAWKKLRTFWDEDSTEVHLSPMHGRAAADPERIERVFTALEMPQDEAREAAEALAAVIGTERWQYGDHPLLTLNAFALDAEASADAGLPAGPDCIVMGDGMLQFMDDLGHGDVAPQVILAHENTHQLQFDLGVFARDLDEDATDAEIAARTRHLELQADAGAAYQATHPRGLTMRAWRVNHVLETTHAIGDCLIEDPSHHGTPQQRRAATDWGVRVQEQARPRGKVMPSRQFITEVDRHVPQILQRG